VDIQRVNQPAGVAAPTEVSCLLVLGLSAPLIGGGAPPANIDFGFFGYEGVAGSHRTRPTI
jgi:hypothetical protein